ncbi:zinc-dependent metalloprotease [Fulvivirga sp. 29W222]|uniref:Zinc-dependent metalloprotease n=1 Tax=Fulvivirga marina TaxID=2494733 RepID=A0A937FTG5_9BACT|nr:T9SS type A sorting domain-containing protein [Fulvivirga marina]MBL6445344.1 zinc-dependent metalloprotease [Fulvivirga marina]
MKQIFLFLIIISTSTFAQNTAPECGTPPLDSASIVNLPWFGNNIFLKEYKQKKEKEKKEKKEKKFKGLEESILSTQTVCTPFDYLVPVRMVIWQNSSNNSQMTSEVAESILMEANNRFLSAGSSIQFYLVRSPLSISNNAYSDGLTGGEELDMFLAQYNSKQITVHLIGGGGSLGTAMKSLKSLWIRTDPNGGNLDLFGSSIYIERLGGTLAHEFGHVLGLSHTHDAARLSTSEDNGAIYNNCYQESVSRSRRNKIGCISTYKKLKCEINGDQLCDTEADPNMNKFSYIDNPNATNGCIYTLPPSGDYRSDNWGILWSPNAKNIMAYNNRRCRNFFSDGQITVMKHTLDTDWSNVTPELSISKSQVCYNGTATVSMPSYYGDGYTSIYGASYRWEDGAGISASSGQTTKSLTVRGTSSSFSGYSPVKVFVSSPVGSFCLQTYVWVGVPPAPASISGNTDSCIGASEFYFTPGSSHASSYDWTIDPFGSNWAIEFENNTESRIRIGYSSAYVNVQAVNNCGSSNKKYILVNGEECDVNCTMRLVLSPNPKKSEVVNLRIIEPCLTTNNADKYIIVIYDNQGHKIIEEQSSENSFQINDILGPGIYHIIVSRKGKVVSEQLIVEE